MASSLKCYFYSRPETWAAWEDMAACPEPGATTVRKCLQKSTGSFKVLEPLPLPLYLCLPASYMAGSVGNEFPG